MRNNKQQSQFEVSCDCGLCYPRVRRRWNKYEVLKEYVMCLSNYPVTLLMLQVFLWRAKCAVDVSIVIIKTRHTRTSPTPTSTSTSERCLWRHYRKKTASPLTTSRSHLTTSDVINNNNNINSAAVILRLVIKPVETGCTNVPLIALFLNLSKRCYERSRSCLSAKFCEDTMNRSWRLLHIIETYKISVQYVLSYRLH